MKTTIEDLQYFEHLPSCNIRKDYHEAYDALSRCQPGPDVDIAYAQLEQRRKQCTCGMEAALNRIIDSAVGAQLDGDA